MVHELVVPLPLPGFQIDADQAFGKQVVAGTMAAVEVRRGRLDRQVNEAELFVRGDLRPDADVAVVGPRLLLPGVVAELAWTGNRVERPQQLAGAHVERPHQALGVVVGRDGRAFTHRGADDHHVLDDGRGRVDADLAGLEVDLLALGPDHPHFQIEDAALAESRNHRAGLGVQLDELITGRHVDHPIVALAVGPEGHATA
jgi:hypothetical protein